DLHSPSFNDTPRLSATSGSAPRAGAMSAGASDLWKLVRTSFNCGSPDVLVEPVQLCAPESERSAQINPRRAGLASESPEQQTRARRDRLRRVLLIDRSLKRSSWRSTGTSK